MRKMTRSKLDLMILLEIPHKSLYLSCRLSSRNWVHKSMQLNLRLLQNILWDDVRADLCRELTAENTHLTPSADTQHQKSIF